MIAQHYRSKRYHGSFLILVLGKTTQS